MQREQREVSAPSFLVQQGALWAHLRWRMPVASVLQAASAQLEQPVAQGPRVRSGQKNPAPEARRVAWGLPERRWAMLPSEYCC